MNKLSEESRHPISNYPMESVKVPNVLFLRNTLTKSKGLFCMLSTTVPLIIWALTVRQIKYNIKVNLIFIIKKWGGFTTSNLKI